MYRSSSEQQERAQVKSLAAELYAEQYSQLLAIARKNAVTGAEAEEALQDAFAQFIAHFDPDGGAPPIAWLILTLKRACWGKRKQLHLDRHVCPEASSEADGPFCVVEQFAASLSDTESSIERAEDLLEAQQRLASLKPDERTALLLLAFGYSYKEIGQLRGWTYTKVNRCISEGRAALRKELRAQE
jgi:RNA polymerase sigma factor (sigma-70 family)